MCGITGIVAPLINDSEHLEKIAVSMADTLYHRGPDASGVFVDAENSLALSHRRLSILDLSSAGSQPMTSKSGHLHISFNGEIYNFQHLQKELLALGHTFIGHSDTEILLAAFEEWGIENSLKRCQGMFALAVWDSTRKELILCRDRMGEKPLFFGWIDNSFVFASELKAIKKAFPHSLEIDQSSAASFFRYGYVPTPKSIYANIFKLLPGTYLRIPLLPFPTVADFNPFPAGDKISPTPYWNLEEKARQGLPDPITDEREAFEYLDNLLRDTISQQRIADVPIGSFLSGGIDSSLVSAVMQAVSNRPIKTFTIGFHEKEFNEAPYARAIADHIGSDHHEYYVSANDGLDLISEIPKYWDEPFADSSQIPSLLVAQKARQQVTVCLTGDGGDELFCGYNRYFRLQKILKIQKKLPPYLRRMTGRLLNSVSAANWQRCYVLLNKLLLRKSTQASFGLQIQKFTEILKMDSQDEAYRFLLSYWQNPGDILPKAEESLSIIDREPNPQMGNLIHDAMYWDQLGYLVDDNLVKGDRSSMAQSLETRLPLLDHRIVEFSWKLPLSMKYRDGSTKWILRRVMDKYIPKELIERPKMGFSVPVGQWLRGPLKEWAADLIHSGKSSDSLVMDQNLTEKVWQEHQSGDRDHSYKLWVMCMWHAWLNH